MQERTILRDQREPPLAMGRRPVVPVQGTVGSQILSWGYNRTSVLGDGSTDNRPTPGPVLLPDGTRIRQVSADYHGLAVTYSGHVLAWGSNAWGALGDGTTTDRYRPVQVLLPSGTVANSVAAGLELGVALTDTGDVYTWGRNNYGQLGIGTADRDSHPIPVRVPIPWRELGLPANIKVTAIETYGSHVLAVTSTGDVIGWGRNSWGELGNGEAKESQPTPVLARLPTAVKVSAVAVGSEHSLAITTTGAALSWGGNNFGQLGNGQWYGPGRIPSWVSLPAGVKLTAINARGGYTCFAVTTDGRALGWGANDQYQTGTVIGGTYVLAPSWVKVPAGVTVTGIAGAWTAGYALTSTGRVLAWGGGTEGEWGNGTTGEKRSTPDLVKMPPRVKVHKIAGGLGAGFAIASPAPKLAWGIQRFRPGRRRQHAGSQPRP